MKLMNILAGLVLVLVTQTTLAAGSLGTWRIAVNAYQFTQTFTAAPVQIQAERVDFQQTEGMQEIGFKVRPARGQAYSDRFTSYITPGVTCPGYSTLIITRENGLYFIEIDYHGVHLGHGSDGSVQEAGHETVKFKGEVLMTQGNWDDFVGHNGQATFVWTDAALQALHKVKVQSTKNMFTEILNFSLQKRGRSYLRSRAENDSSRLNTSEVYTGTVQSLHGTGMTYDFSYKADEYRL